LRGGEVRVVEGFGADGPDGGDPGEFGADVPLVSEVKPLARANGDFDLFAGFEGEEGGIADEDGGVRVLEHGDWVGCGGNKGGMGPEELSEEDFGVGEGTAGGCVGGDGLYCAKSVRGFDDELDGADFVQRSNRATGDDGEIGGEGRDGDEAEIGAGGKELVGAKRRLGVVEGIAPGESGGQGWVLEVPHEGSGIEEVDSGDAEPGGW